LGSLPRVKYSEARNTSLGAAAGQGTQHPFSLAGINVNYSDSGLFGFAVGAAASDVHNVVKNVVKKMREVGKGLTEAQLKTAKQQLKAHVLMSFEEQNQVLEELGVQLLNGSTPLGVDNAESAIDALSLNEVNEVVSKTLKGKVAIAAVGSVSNVPHAEDLV